VVKLSDEELVAAGRARTAELADLCPAASGSGRPEPKTF
jgi:hypothetical protein